MKGILFPIFRFGERSEIEVNFGKRRKFVYDIEAHDWTVEKSARALRARAVRARNSK